MASYSETGDGGCVTSGFSPGLYTQNVFFPQTRSSRKGVCSESKDAISKNTIIAMYPDSSATKIWLQNLTDDQWSITSFNPRKRQVCIDVIGLESNIINTLTLTIPRLI